MLSEIMSSNQLAHTNSPILNSLMRDNPGVDLEEEKLKEEFVDFQKNLHELSNIKQNDKIGRDSDGKYYIFSASMFQKLTRLIYRENREWTFKYLDEDFTKFMKFLDNVIAKYKSNYTMAMKIFVSKITDFIDNIMPGLYHLKKTYPEESNLVAKIDSIIVTLIDFKDSTRRNTNMNIVTSVLRKRALSE